METRGEPTLVQGVPLFLPLPLAPGSGLMFLLVLTLNRSYLLPSGAFSSHRTPSTQEPWAVLATQRAPQMGRALGRGHTTMGLLPWGQGQTKSGKMTPWLLPA